MTNQTQQSTIVETADAVKDSWVYGKAPNSWRPYLKLARMDRPVGTWLLLWPCWWALLLASDTLTLTTVYDMALFALGALVMRGAGCTFNDIIDRDIDEQVDRTRTRPIPAGEVTSVKAAVFLVVLSYIGFAVLMQFNMFTVTLGFVSLALVAVYPFMKRLTNWPQAWLGLTFNWGALLGFAAVEGSLSATAYVLYAGCWLWTLGYDTIYAHQDREDDAIVGVKSSALALGDKTITALKLFYSGFIIALTSLVMLANVGIFYYISLAFAAIHLIKQIKDVDINDPDVCLRVFRSNITFGWILMIGLTLDRLI